MENECGMHRSEGEAVISFSRSPFKLVFWCSDLVGIIWLGYGWEVRVLRLVVANDGVVIPHP